jgi:glycosyltransferase involved in cell wall biosynthesis
MNAAEGRIRVLHVRSSSGFYGAEAVISSYFTALQDASAEMELLLLTTMTDHPLLDRLQAPVRVIHAASGLSPALFGTVREHLRQGAFDILHTHDYKSDVIGYFCRRQITWLSTVHGWTRSDAKVRLYEWLDRRLLVHADGVAAVSRELHDQFARMGLSGKRNLYLPNAIDCDVFTPVRRQTKGLCRIAIVARLSPEKAIHHLLEAFAELPEACRLNIIGDGSLRLQLQLLAEQLRIDGRVAFLGVRSDIPALLAETDIFVLPSLREGTPMALLEAMAAGCAVAASAVGNIPQIIRTGENGLLTVPGDTKSLVAALSALAADPALRGKLGIAARRFVTEQYSLPRVKEQLLNFYQSQVNAA